MERDTLPIAGRRRTVDSDAYCPRCGHNLRGTETDESDVCTCPECAEQCTAYLLLEKPPGPGINAAQWSLAGIIMALAVFVASYHLLSAAGLLQTAALFIGLPALLAVIVTLAPRASSATGMCVKGMTIALLVSGIFLGEGFVCVLMMAPLFYLVGIIVGVIIDVALKLGRSGRGRVSGIRLRCWIAGPLLLLSLEGTTPRLAFNRAASVSRTAVVAAPPGDVAAALSAPPRLAVPLPAYLRLGFPRPAGSRGGGLAVGDERVIRFETLRAGGSGDLRLRVVERGEGRAVFEAVSDTSKIARWLRWRRAEVTWAAAPGGGTTVTWRLDYERWLDPAWYFGPWQQYAVGLAADYLIRTAATPPQKE